MVFPAESIPGSASILRLASPEGACDVSTGLVACVGGTNEALRTCWRKILFCLSTASVRLARVAVTFLRLSVTFFLFVFAGLFWLSGFLFLDSPSEEEELEDEEEIWTVLVLVSFFF